MTIVFSNAREIIYIDYLGKEQTMNEECYTSLLHMLRKEIEEKVLIWQRKNSLKI